jgi:hypothetical protein
LKRIRAVAGIGLLLTALIAGAAAPGYAYAAQPDFAAQARAAGLTGVQAASLQQRVDTYLARAGGTQVAINKISLDGKGDIVLALPGERHAWEIGTGGVGTLAVCDPGNFCAFSQTELHGDILKYYYCAYKLSMPFAGYGSYLNNQTQGTSAHFYSSTGAYMYDSIGAVAVVRTFNWSYVYWIKPCGAI